MTKKELHIQEAKQLAIADLIKLGDNIISYFKEIKERLHPSIEDAELAVLGGLLTYIDAKLANEEQLQRDVLKLLKFKIESHSSTSHH